MASSSNSWVAVSSMDQPLTGKKDLITAENKGALKFVNYCFYSTIWRDCILYLKCNVSCPDCSALLLHQSYSISLAFPFLLLPQAHQLVSKLTSFLKYTAWVPPMGIDGTIGRIYLLRTGAAAAPGSQNYKLHKTSQTALYISFSN